MLLRIDGVSENIDLTNQTLQYITKSENNSNVLFIKDKELGQNCNIGTLGYYGYLSVVEQSMLLRNASITKAIKAGNIDNVKALLSNANKINQYNLVKEISIKEIIKVDKDSDFEVDFAIFMI